MLQFGRPRWAGSMLAALALLAGSTALQVVLSAPAGADTGSAVTVTGPHAWDPKAGKQYSQASTVTVAQTRNLTDQVVQVSWTHFTPSSEHAFDQQIIKYPVAVYQCQGTSVTSESQCEGMPAYDTKHSVNSITDDNLIQTFTSADGTGYADIALHTSDTDADLGCDDQHACSIAVVPNWGGIQPITPGATPNCTSHIFDQLLNYAGAPYLAAACSWANRIVVPISFSLTAGVCSAGDPSFDSEGSPMTQRAVNLWRTPLCAASTPNRVGYNSGVNEYAARTDFLNGNTDMALTTQPATGTAVNGRKFTYAPLANSGIAIAYYVDDATTGRQITNLRLDARLVAKMLTESYGGGLGCPATGQVPCAPEVTGNPVSIFNDPEFLALNPGVKPGDFSNIATASFPIVVQSDSDLTYELTRWIASDPDASAFLSGTADKWGMKINKFYLPPTSPKYPVSVFTPNDPGQVNHLPVKVCATNYACDIYGLQAMWNPVSGLDHVSKKLLAGTTTAVDPHAVCGTLGGIIVNGFCSNHPGLTPQNVGQRAIFAVVPAGDAAAFQFPTAQLETTPGHFVGPDAGSFDAALATMKTNPDGITQAEDHSKQTAGAYPLTMVDYALVPTCGLSTAAAPKMADFLTYVGSTPAQTSGVLPGALAPGFAPLSSAQAAQTVKAAGAVSSAKCPTTTPPPTSAPTHPPTRHPTRSPTSGPTGGSGGSSGGGGSGGSGGGSGAAGAGSGGGSGRGGGSGSGSSASPSARPSGSAGAASTGGGNQPVSARRSGSPVGPTAFGEPDRDQSGLTGIMLPLALGLVGLLLVGAPATIVAIRTGAGAALLARLRNLRA